MVNYERVTMSISKGLTDEVHLFGGNVSALCDFALKGYVETMKRKSLTAYMPATRQELQDIIDGKTVCNGLTKERAAELAKDIWKLQFKEEYGFAGDFNVNK